MAAFFPDDILIWNFLNENVWIPIKISLKLVPKGPINNIPALVQIMAWRRPGDKPLSEQMMIILLAHICVTRPQWVKATWIAHERKYTCKIFMNFFYICFYLYIYIYIYIYTHKHIFWQHLLIHKYLIFSIHLIFTSQIRHRRIRDCFYKMAYMCTYPVSLHGLHGLWCRIS